MADIPHFFCDVRAEYLYDGRSHHGEFTPVQVIGVDSVYGQAIGFDVLTAFGGLFSRVPISALCWRHDAPIRDLHELELWNNFSYEVEAHEYQALSGLCCAVILKDGKWYDGKYMFTLSWYGSQHADTPGDGGYKRAHIIQLDEGNYAAQPNNRCRFFEPSFITKPWPKKPDFLTNTTVWNAETEGKWQTEDNDKYYYNLNTTDEKETNNGS